MGGVTSICSHFFAFKLNSKVGFTVACGILWHCVVLFLRYKIVKLGLPLRVVLSDIVCFVFAIKRLMLGSPLHVVLCGNSDREAYGRESLLSAPSTWN